MLVADRHELRFCVLEQSVLSAGGGHVLWLLVVMPAAGRAGVRESRCGRKMMQTC